MKRIIVFLFILFALCGCENNQAELAQLRKEKEQLTAQVSADAAIIQTLRDSITMLSFPADQRLLKINSLVSSGDYSAAKKRDITFADFVPRIKRSEIFSFNN